MNILLLSAGYGKRLKELTKDKPKCLIEINKIPIIDIWLNKIKKIKYSEIFINTHYMYESVNHHLKDKLEKFRIKLLYEKDLLGTAGTISKNIDQFKDKDLMIIHCDNFTDFELNDLINIHYSRPITCEVTMLTFKTEKPKQSGIVVTDKNDILIDYYEKVKNPPNKIANAAIYIISQKFLNNEYSKFNNAKEFTKDVIPYLMGKIFTFKTENFFIDIGDLESLKKANVWASNNKF